jgi:hypothetical protein
LFIRDGYVGVHAVDIPSHDDSKTWLYNWLGYLFYTPILPLAKISVLVFLLRLGGRQNRGVRIAIHGLIAFNTAQLISGMAFTLFRCRPVHLAWTAYFSPESMGHCGNLASYIMTAGSINILTDLLVLILPFRIFLDLKINKKMRNALITMFMLGIG